jgi:hypothetical protein
MVEDIFEKDVRIVKTTVMSHHDDIKTFAYEAKNILEKIM